jgi:hypothetical protein
MMQSVAMCDLQRTELEDYILVDHASELSDDDSYDYLEDMVSTQLPKQAAGTACYDINRNPLPRDLVFSVPSVLMKDLDEAHAAAKLAQIAEPDQPNYESPEPSGKSEEETPADSKSETQNGAALVENEKSEKRKEAEQESASKAALTMSRASNKKRRKKLKMTKKTQAAMNAAEALSRKPNQANSPSPTMPGKSPKQSQTTASRLNKTPNLAVACATETLASYRQELLRNRHACA